MISQQLAKRAAARNPIRVASVGSGWMGTGFLAAVRHVPGMEVSILVDEDPAAATAALTEFAGVDRDRIVVTEDSGAAADAIAAGKRVVTPSLRVATAIEQIDVFTDVTPSPASGAATAAAAIDSGHDVVLINIEADVTVGSQLKQRAKKAGVLYSVSSGDEPGCLMELWDFVSTLGYTPIVIGKGKNNPLNVEATPDTVRESAAKAGKDPYQVASYVDGSKTMFEMCCVANATGCRPMQPGMTGPEATTETVSQVFALKEDGGTTTAPGTVDYVQGSSMSGGVFITVKIDDARIADDLNYLKVGKGKYFTFFRPYHLWFLEAPISIARAVLNRETTLVPLDAPTADSLTVAKRGLKPGDVLDTFGGYTFRGVLYDATQTMQVAGGKRALPVGLAPGAKIVTPVAAGKIVTWDDVELDESAPVVSLRREQDGRTG